uniref:Uncharacterized protein n=1 Tax=Oryza sativa subsp. japonica TaxID=39947 RepID=Q6H6K9_ORYSJ|nr:hypothetical protein [Oryza sativa Japonica Group]BAD27683.1 hypothetical protein [Oryza sativa Japonica Group]
MAVGGLARRWAVTRADGEAPAAAPKPRGWRRAEVAASGGGSGGREPPKTGKTVGRGHSRDPLRKRGGRG